MEWFELAGPVAGGDGHVALAIGVDCEDGGAGHLSADADADILVFGGEGDGDEDVAALGAGGAGRRGDADGVVDAGYWGEGG